MSRMMNVGLDEALTSDKPQVRMLARGSASAWSEGFQAWVNDEAQRGANPIDLMMVVMRLHIMISSSMCSHFLDKPGLAIAAQGYKAMIDEMFVEHGLRAREEFKKGEGR